MFAQKNHKPPFRLDWLIYSLLISFLTFLTDSCSLLSSKSCSACECDPEGSVSQTCDQTGKCRCKDKFSGNKCRDRNCEVGAWSAWSLANCPCGETGTKTSERSIITSPLGNGERCPNLDITDECKARQCPCQPKYFGLKCQNYHCEMTTWSGWTGHCKKCTSNNGSQYRTRGIAKNKEGAGRACGDKKEWKRCPEVPCRVICLPQSGCYKVPRK